MKVCMCEVCMCEGVHMRMCMMCECVHGEGVHLPVTPAQLMRPGIGRNASCAVGDFA